MTETDLCTRLQLFIAHNNSFQKVNELLREGAASLVKFEGDEQVYEWVKENGVHVLRPGVPEQPLLYFKFTASALDYLAAIDSNDAGDFVYRLIDCIISADPQKKIEFRVKANLLQLTRSGLFNLLLAGGRKTATLAANIGIKSIGDLRRKLMEYTG